MNMNGANTSGKLASVGGKTWNSSQDSDSNLFRKDLEHWRRPSDKNDKVGAKSQSGDRDNNIYTNEYMKHSKDKTWEQVGPKERVLDSVATRQEIEELKKQLTRAMQASERELRMIRGSGDGLSMNPRMEHDMASTKNGVLQFLNILNDMNEHGVTEQSTKHIQLRVSTALYEQKWIDQAFDMATHQLYTRDQEMAELFELLRFYISRSFTALAQGYAKTIEEFHLCASKISEYQAELKRLQTDQEEILKIKRLEIEQIFAERAKTAENTIRSREHDIENLKKENARIATSLASLNKMFEAMQQNEATVEAVDMIAANTQLRTKLERSFRELEKLRPLLEREIQLSKTNQMQNLQMEKLQKKMDTIQAEMLQKNVLLNGVLEKFGHAMDAGHQPIALSESSVASSKVAYPEMPSTKSIPCVGFRILLSDTGAAGADKPIHSTTWTWKCMRAILQSRRSQYHTTDSSSNKSTSSVTRRPSIRFPEFVYMWFAPTRSQLQALAEAEGSKGVQATLAKADYERWALYHGTIKMIPESAEAQLFFTFLNEDHEGDDLEFYLHCISQLETLMKEANETLAKCGWDVNTKTDSYEVFSGNQNDLESSDTEDDHLLIEVSVATNLVKRVMSRAPDPTVKAILKDLAELATKEPHRVDASSGNRVVDVHECLSLLVGYFRGELQQRYMAVRMMFETATVGIADEGKTGPRCVNLQQFLSITRSLNQAVTETEAISLYRDAYEIGQGLVTLETFYEVARRYRLFSGSFIHVR